MSTAVLDLVALPTVRKLSGRVLAVLGLNPSQFTLQGTNTYIVGTGRSRILLDTGEGAEGYQELLLDTLQNAGVTSISHILCTHRHHDHIGGIEQVRNVVSKLGQNPSTLHIHKRITHCDEPRYLEYFKPIQDGQIYETEGASLKAIYTPGHTDDHVSFTLSEEAAVFTGDCVLGQGSAIFSNLSLLMASLETLKGLMPQKLYPGHGPSIEHGAVAKISEYLEHRRQREAHILHVMGGDLSGKPYWTLDDISKAHIQRVSSLHHACSKSVCQTPSRETLF
ncbi:hypothetical protein BASA62_008816 [Batrachochytrium salamandrivorans]|nr:hypothetical protein BASA62_008816 [Batrachochytrium salamandrivorans]